MSTENERLNDLVRQSGSVTIQVMKRATWGRLNRRVGDSKQDYKERTRYSILVSSLTRKTWFLTPFDRKGHIYTTDVYTDTRNAFFTHYGLCPCSLRLPTPPGGLLIPSFPIFPCFPPIRYLSSPSFPIPYLWDTGTNKIGK
jgi:hypothetical protein